jgi:transaldolase/glucose-6-phosphate isomerase
MPGLDELAEQGQSVWLDSLRHFLITSGELQELIDTGVRGLIFNPAILEAVVAGSADYDAQLRDLSGDKRSAEAFHEALVFADARRVADLLACVYDRTDGVDGYVNLGINPQRARTSEDAVAEARRLHAALRRPNVMIEIPATPAGIRAIEALVAEGMNVSASLVFSLAQYEAVAKAYIAGLEARAESGGDLSKVASVAAITLDRTDAAVDLALESLEKTTLRGKIAIAGARMIRARFGEIFAGPSWERLTGKGARVQRLLWVGTAVPDPSLSDTLYLDGLIGRDTVASVSRATLRAFLDHGRVAGTLDGQHDEARARVLRLTELGVDLNAITRKLQDEGVAAGIRCWDNLMAGIERKQQRLRADWGNLRSDLGSGRSAAAGALEEIRQNRIVQRIWQHDHSVWKDDPSEISNRLGWLHAGRSMVVNLPRLRSLADSARGAGFTHALLLGMGGSSLAPEVFRRTFGVQEGYLDLAVLDSTDPGAIRAQAERLDPAHTLLIVSSKSGGTVETLSLFKYFYTRALDALGRDRARRSSVAITDPGSDLASLAEAHGFRAIFRNDANIGGRYAALFYFGLVPAALIGVDLELLLKRALAMACNCAGCNCSVVGNNQGAELGAILGEFARAGRDKVTFVISDAVASLGEWIEQLIAESTGKEGSGILPVVGEEIGHPDSYGTDRLFVHVRLDGDESRDAAVQRLRDAGQPVVCLHLADAYDLGAQFFLWEMATAVAAYRLGVNPFDQPNVKAAKTLAHRMVSAYEEDGRLPGATAAFESEGITVYSDLRATSPGEALAAFVEQAQPGSYVAIQAFVEATAEIEAGLQMLRARLGRRTGLATTVGYGPRFLHSTGQLHKGDAGRGLFVQLTADAVADIPIPAEVGGSESVISFGILEAAQALGDRQALLDAGRKVIRFHLGTDVAGGLRRLAEAI